MSYPMAVFFKKTWEFISGAATLWGFMPAAWQTVLVAGATSVTGYLGWQTATPFYACIGAAGVFALSMFGVFLINAGAKLTGTFERLTVEQINLFNPTLQQDKDGRNKKIFLLKNLTFECVLKSHSQQMMYFKIKRASQSMAGRTIVGEPKLSSLTSIVPPFSYQKITLQSLPDIDVADGMIGVIELEILYGEDKEDLKYKFTYESAPQLAIVFQKGGNATIAMNAPITKHAHEQIK
jgi:hypothetical protein